MARTRPRRRRGGRGGWRRSGPSCAPGTGSASAAGGTCRITRTMSRCRSSVGSSQPSRKPSRNRTSLDADRRGRVPLLLLAEGRHLLARGVVEPALVAAGARAVGDLDAGAVQVATVPEAPKSRSSGCAATHSTRSTSESSSGTAVMVGRGGRPGPALAADESARIPRRPASIGRRPSAASRCAVACGNRPPARRRAPGDHEVEARPATSDVGTRTSPSSKPQGRVKARSSSSHPSTPRQAAPCRRRGPRRARRRARRGRRAAGSRSPRRSAPASPREAGPGRLQVLRSGPSPVSAAPNSSRLSWPIPARKSRSGASDGAAPAIDATAVTRSGSRAAVARACGPPPLAPITATRSRPRWSRTASTSAATSPTERPGSGSDPA